MTKMSSDPTIGMRGNYSDNVLGAKKVIEATVPLVREALRDTLSRASPTKVFAVADFGAADGGTSLDLMREVVRRVWKARPKRTITLTYTDLPFNDFSSLFRRIHGLNDAGDETPLGHVPELLTFASATSFHRQIFPADSLSFGFSASAMHWLSGKPGPIADHVQAVGATELELSAYRRQASLDWTAILLARAHELVSGGRLVFANFCVDERGRYLGSTSDAKIFDTLANCWRTLAASNVITGDEYQAATLQQYYRTKNELVAPFEDPTSPVSRAGLRLEHVMTVFTDCPFAAKFREHGDPVAYARAYVPSIRAWSESTFASALDRRRSEAERTNIVDQLYRAYEADVIARPGAHRSDRAHCIQTIAKI